MAPPAPREFVGPAAAAARHEGARGGPKKRGLETRFEWNASEDTTAALDPLFRSSSAAAPAGLAGGEDALAAADRRRAAREAALEAGGGKRSRAGEHWSAKALDEMTDRDWRIVREDFDIYVKGPRVPFPARNWGEMQLPSAVRDAIQRAGYARPSAIQMQAIPVGLQMRDIIGVAETGSGKTAAFLVPLLSLLARLPAARLRSCVEDGPLAVIMGPTRELVQQIGEEARKLSLGLGGVRCVVVVGGNSIQEQISELRLGAQIVAATPGRLLDCLSNRYVVFNQCCYLVLDEADRMIDMGFEPQVESVLKNMVATQKADAEEQVMAQEAAALAGTAETVTRTTIMFSATMPPAVERLANSYMRFPVVVRIGDVDSGKNARIRQQVLLVAGEAKKKAALLQLLQETAPPVIVFVNSKGGCDTVGRFLEGSRWRSTVLHGGRQQAQREASLAGFKSGRFDVLIATDVAGRGLDISDVAHVVNFEMASDIDRYTHRIGRTGRAGKSGLASTILTEEDADMFLPLVQYLRSTSAQVPRELAMHPKVKSADDRLR